MATYKAGQAQILLEIFVDVEKKVLLKAYDVISDLHKTVDIIKLKQQSEGKKSKLLPRKWSFHGPEYISHLGLLFNYDIFLEIKPKKQLIKDRTVEAPDHPEVTAYRIWPDSYYLP
eukprot:UN04283